MGVVKAMAGSGFQGRGRHKGSQGEAQGSGRGAVVIVGTVQDGELPLPKLFPEVIFRWVKYLAICSDIYWEGSHIYKS